jgi:hypothetical protein
VRASTHDRTFGGAMERLCQACAAPLTTKNVRAKFCSPTCRSRVSEGRVVPLERTQTTAPGLPSLVESVRADLRRADAESSGLGVSALLLAAQIDGRQEPGSALAALNRELRATLAEATRGQVKSGLASMRDELAERRARA